MMVLMSEAVVTPGQMLRLTVAATPIQVPGAPNALAGRLIEEMGFVVTRHEAVPAGHS